MLVILLEIKVVQMVKEQMLIFMIQAVFVFLLMAPML